MFNSANFFKVGEGLTKFQETLHSSTIMYKIVEYVSCLRFIVTERDYERGEHSMKSAPFIVGAVLPLASHVKVPIGGMVLEFNKPSIRDSIVFDLVYEDYLERDENEGETVHEHKIYFAIDRVTNTFDRFSVSIVLHIDTTNSSGDGSVFVLPLKSYELSKA